MQSILKHRNRITLLLTILFGAPILLFSFQNCGKAGFETNGEDLASTDENAAGETDTTAEFGKIPFAFDASINQLTYMSCAANNNPQACPHGASCGAENLSNRDAFFTFRVGAYDDLTSYSNSVYRSAGIKFTDAFLNYVKDVSRVPGMTAGSMTPEQAFSVLDSSEENKDARIMFSIRAVNATRTSIITQAAPQEGIDFAYALTPLTEAQVAVPLAQQTNKYTNFFAMNSMSPDTRSLEGSLYFNFDLTTLKNLVTNMQYNALTLTYTGTADELNAGMHVARAPTSLPNSEMQKAYGRKYSIGFEPSFNADKNPVPNGITEFDLLQNKQITDVNWDCLSIPKYVIVRPEDSNLCPPMSLNELADPRNKFEMEVMRRHLKSENWIVNTARKCMVPKSGSCYKTYSALNGATPITVDYTNANCGLTTSKDCPHYVKVCLRK